MTYTYSNLPYELESEILSRVPATSLSKLRFTCKRWYALSKDPVFIKKNSGKAANQVILHTDQKIHSVNINPDNDPSIEFNGSLKSLKHSKHVMISYIFHCDGLLLCITKDYRLAVWNPCTGQTRWIEAKALREGCTIEDRDYFLGKSCDSYKILSVNCYEIEQRLSDLESDIDDETLDVTEFAVYEFSSDSWRVLDGITDELGTLSLGVSLKGNNYWFESDREVDGQVVPNAILKFDYTTERFERLSPPSQSDDDYYEMVILSVVKDEKLALLRDTTECFWMLKIMVSNSLSDDAKDLSWSDFFVVNLGKVLETKVISNSMSFLVDEENKSVLWRGPDRRGHKSCYRIDLFGDQDIHKRVYEEITTKTWAHMLSYVPSMVQIPTRQRNNRGAK